MSFVPQAAVKEVNRKRHRGRPLTHIASVTAVGIIRLVMFRVAWDSPETLDYFNSWGPVLGQIESALAIITACIPTLKPVAAIWFPALLPTKTDNYGSENFMASRTFGGTAVTRPGHSSVVPNTFVLRNLGRTRNTIRGHSPSESEEEIMAAHGITRTTRVSLKTPLLLMVSTKVEE